MFILLHRWGNTRLNKMPGLRLSVSKQQSSYLSDAKVLSLGSTTRYYLYNAPLTHQRGYKELSAPTIHLIIVKIHPGNPPGLDVNFIPMDKDHYCTVNTYLSSPSCSVSFIPSHWVKHLIKTSSAWDPTRSLYPSALRLDLSGHQDLSFYSVLFNCFHPWLLLPCSSGILQHWVNLAIHILHACIRAAEQCQGISSELPEPCHGPWPSTADGTSALLTNSSMVP